MARGRGRGRGRRGGRGRGGRGRGRGGRGGRRGGSESRFFNKRKNFTVDDDEEEGNAKKYPRIQDEIRPRSEAGKAASVEMDEPSEEEEEEEHVKDPVMELMSTFDGNPQFTQAIDTDDESEDDEEEDDDVQSEQNDEEEEESEDNNVTNEGTETVDEDDVTNGTDEENEGDVTNGTDEENEGDVTNGTDEENEGDVANGNEDDVTEESEDDDDVTEEDAAEDDVMNTDAENADEDDDENWEDVDESDVTDEDAITSNDVTNEAEVNEDDDTADDSKDVVTDEEFSEDDDQVQDEQSTVDPFLQHYNQMLTAPFVQELTKKENWKTSEELWPRSGRISKTFLRLDLDESVKRPSSDQSIIEPNKGLKDLFVKSQLHKGWKKVNPDATTEGDSPFTDLQRELFSVMNSYSDLLFCRRTIENSEELRATYCLHILNHVLKARYNIYKHDSQLNKYEDVPEEFRDQGLTRPKVLILVPFRDSAWRIVDKLIDLLCPEDTKSVLNKKRFWDEYGHDGSKFKKKKRKFPRDYFATFTGNIDDNFRFGIAVTKKSMRLYSNFYSTDIIIASPLGLRTIVGATGEKGRDYDFLSSVEILVVDQAEVLLMQNWEHLTHVLEHCHLLPQESHDADFFRVRSWSLEGWGKHYRQSMCFSGIACPEVHSIFSRFSCNYAGVVKTLDPLGRGSIRQVVAQMPQVFQKFTSSSPKEDADTRFEYFVSKVFPQFKEAVMTRTMIFVPSYFDYVRLRNHFKKEEVSFTQICEYTTKAKVIQARDRFFHAERRYLLYTERAHFYNRYFTKGIRHLVFYQLPVLPDYYSEICNLTRLRGKKETQTEDGYFTCTVMFSKYDAHRLAAVVGTERAAHMITSDKDVFMFITGDT